MAITIKELLASDTISQAADKVNFNFDQLLLNGGGPMGPQGPQGPPGPVGGRGIRGSQWYEGAVDPNTVIFPDLEENDSYLQSNGDVWEYNGTAWVLTGINLEGPAGPAGASIWGETGNPTVGGQQITYPTTYPGDQLRSVLVGAVPTSDTVINPVFHASLPITNGLNITNTALAIQVPSAAQAAVRFLGSLAAGVDYTQNVFDAQSIFLFDGDMLRFEDPKLPTAATQTLGYYFRTAERGYQMDTGQGYLLQTGNAIDATNPVSSTSDITLRIVADPPTALSPGEIFLQNQTGAQDAGFKVGTTDSGLSGAPLFGNIWGEGQEFFWNAQFGYNVRAYGAGGQNFIADVADITISTPSAGTGTTIQSPFDTLTVNSIGVTLQTQSIIQAVATGAFQSEHNITVDGKYKVQNGSANDNNETIGLQIGDFADDNVFNFMSHLNVAGEVRENRIESNSTVGGGRIQIYSSNNVGSNSGVAIYTDPADPNVNDGYFNWNIDGLGGGMSFYGPDRYTNDFTPAKGGASSSPIFLGNWDDFGVAGREQEYGIHIRPSNIGGYSIGAVGVGDNSAAIIGKFGSNATQVGPFYNQPFGSYDSDSQIFGDATILANDTSGGVVGLIPGSNGLVVSPDNTAWLWGAAGASMETRYAPSAITRNGRGSLLSNYSNQGGIHIYSRTNQEIIPNNLDNAGSDNVNFNGQRVSITLNETQSFGTALVFGDNNADANAFTGSAHMGFAQVGGAVTPTASTLSTGILWSNASGDLMGVCRYWNVPNQSQGETNVQTSGYLSVKGRELVINTMGDGVSGDGSDRYIRIGGGWRSQVAVNRNDDSEFTNGQTTSVRLGDGYMAQTTDSFLSIKRTRLDSTAGTGEYLIIQSNNAITRGSSISDIRLKTNVKPVKSTLLDKLNKIGIIEYDWKWDKYMKGAPGWNSEKQDGKHLGFSAQEVEKLFPSVIGQGVFEEAECDILGISYAKDIDEDGIPDGYDDPKKFTKRNILVDKFVPILIKSIQELSAENTALKERLEAIEKKLGI